MIHLKAQTHIVNFVTNLISQKSNSPTPCLCKKCESTWQPNSKPCHTQKIVIAHRKKCDSTFTKNVTTCGEKKHVNNNATHSTWPWCSLIGSKCLSYTRGWTNWFNRDGRSLAKTSQTLYSPRRWRWKTRWAHKTIPTKKTAFAAACCGNSKHAIYMPSMPCTWAQATRNSVAAHRIAQQEPSRLGDRILRKCTSLDSQNRQYSRRMQHPAWPRCWDTWSEDCFYNCS